MNYSCALCGFALVDSKDRYSVVGRSSFKILEAITSLPFSVSVNNDSYVCRKCLSRLKKKKSLEETYDKCLKELQDLVENAPVAPMLLQPSATSTPVKATPSETSDKPPRTNVLVSLTYFFLVFFHPNLIFSTPRS